MDKNSRSVKKQAAEAGCFSFYMEMSQAARLCEPQRVSVFFYNAFMIRLQLRFIVRVQGVGFRWTARNIADSLGLTGWVLNDWDGSVLMEVQGKKETIEKLIEGLERGTFINIERIEREQIPLTEYEHSFKIKDEW